MLDTFTVSTEIHTIEFQITECHPREYCSVTHSTEIHSEGRPLERREEDKADISGFRHQLDLLGELAPMSDPRIRQWRSGGRLQ
jgi:hypothetical protein